MIIIVHKICNHSSWESLNLGYTSVISSLYQMYEFWTLSKNVTCKWTISSASLVHLCCFLWRRIITEFWVQKIVLRDLILVNKICYITLLYQMYEFGIAFKIMTSYSDWYKGFLKEPNQLFQLSFICFPSFFLLNIIHKEYDLTENNPLAVSVFSHWPKI